MMTPQMLDRASSAFRQGYRASPDAVNPYQPGTFAHYDWAEGMSAANAERKYGERRVTRLVP